MPVGFSPCLAIRDSYMFPILSISCSWSSEASGKRCDVLTLTMDIDTDLSSHPHPV
jgi:hypothetical protein